MTRLRFRVFAKTRVREDAMSLEREDAFFRYRVYASSRERARSIFPRNEARLAKKGRAAWNHSGGQSFRDIGRTATVRDDKPPEMVPDELLNEGRPVKAEHRRMDGEALGRLNREVDSGFDLLGGLPVSRFSALAFLRFARL